MKQGEYKVINGIYVKKETNAKFLTRYGYAKSGYGLYESYEDMVKGNRFSFVWSMQDVRDSVK